MAYHILLC